MNKRPFIERRREQPLRRYEVLCRPPRLLKPVLLGALYGETDRTPSITRIDRRNLYPSARAGLLTKLGRNGEAKAAWRAALERATDPTERRFLERRLR